MILRLPLAILLAVFFLPLLAHGDVDYSTSLLQRADTLKLAEHPAWRKLLHYESSSFALGLKSVVDDPAFFTAAEGKTDPHAELAATLLGFFSTEPKGPAGQTLYCAFPARFVWLKEMLSIDEAKLPPQNCARFEEWKEALNVESVTVVYPSSYLNNPASMFGHTLLRLDAKGQTESTRLLAYGSSYAAATAETSGFIFAFRGITGLYRGAFSISPYYKLVRDYNDIENRDMWEYELALSKHEVEQVVRHLWELGAVWFDYYFFDENCSYQLLALLEGAIPRLNLTQDFSFWVSPPESVRTLLKEPQIVRKITFRPAKSSIVKEEEKRLAASSQSLVRPLIRGELDFSEVKRQSGDDYPRVLELGFDYLEYLQNSGATSPVNADVRAREILVERSSLGRELPQILPPAPAVRPDEGHRGGRLTLLGGSNEDGPFGEFAYRPVFHELLDPEPGYTRGAELRFFDTRLRYSEDKHLRLEGFTPLAIQSLTPRTELFRSISWKAGTAIQRSRVDGERGEFLLSQIYAGAGLSKSLGESGLAYLFLTGTGFQSRHLSHHVTIDTGPEGGVFLDLTEQLRLKVDGWYRRTAFNQDTENAGAAIRAMYVLSLGSVLRLSLERKSEFSILQNELSVGASVYF